MRPLLIFLFFLLILSCKDSNSPEPMENMYFPDAQWETISPEDLNWDQSALDELLNFVESNDSRAFIILKNGKIVVEEYWGKNILGTKDFDVNSQWYWASAGKTLTATLVGIAQEQGVLSIEDKTSDYLGPTWSAVPKNKQDLITVKHHLSMTTGLDYTLGDLDCTDSSCLQYKSDAGTQWFYHNAAYTLLEQVVSNASGKSYNVFTDMYIEQPIGMSGNWVGLGYNNVYWSTARDAARFGLLLLNKGQWKDLEIVNPTYHQDMINSSQSLNPSYGYLTWLNGKSSIVLPGLPNSFNVPLSQDGPSDLYAAMGKNGQIIDVVESLGLVIIRMGDSPDNSLVPTVFHNNMWKKINAVIAN